MIGKIIGNYKIEKKLGEGGMGAVYKGVDTMLDREVAIKALRPELVSQASVVERFRSEAVTLAKLHHPNIATLYSLFRHGEELYMVIEYVRGETLDSIIQRRGALSAEEVIPVFCQILDGIDHAHELGIVHRDIKPANMMLTEKGTLKVLDFGIARLLGSARMTRAGNIIGTLEYMAPEQVKGQETDARTDIYALGMMLYEVLTGRTPFDTDNEFELMKLQTEAMPQSPRSINPSIPAEVEAAIMRSIQKNPDARFQTAGEFREVLLDAGFDANGAMRRITGSRQSRVNTRPPPPEILQPNGKEPSVISENGIKETRLGESAAVPSANYEIKETRLGASIVTASEAVEPIKEARLGEPNFLNSYKATTDEQSNSFFSNLTWIHYAGAGVAGVVLLGLLAIVPILVLSGNTRQDNANVTGIKPANTPAVENTAPKPTASSTPERTQIITRSAENDTPTPISTPTVEPVTTPTPAERITKRTTPAPTPKPTPIRDTKRIRETEEQRLARARCLLTGDCPKRQQKEK